VLLVVAPVEALASVNYWSDVVQPMHPDAFVELNNGPSSGCSNASAVYFDHAANSGAGGAVGDPRCSGGVGSFGQVAGPKGFGTAQQLTCTLGAHPSNSGTTCTSIGINGLPGAASSGYLSGGFGMVVWVNQSSVQDMVGYAQDGASWGWVSDDGGHTIKFYYKSGGSLAWYQTAFDSYNAWHMLGAQWTPAGGGTWVLWADDHQVHQITGADQPNGSSSTILGFPGHPIADQFSYGQGGYQVAFYGLGMFSGTQAAALTQPTPGCSGPSCANEFTTLWAAAPFAANPPGTVCSPNADGSFSCVQPDNGGGGVNGNGQAAPLSGSHAKPQLGYLQLEDCGTVTVWDPSNWVPYLACRIGNYIKIGCNAVIFVANAAIDIVWPDGSGLVQGYADVNGKVSGKPPWNYPTDVVDVVTGITATGAVHPTFTFAVFKQQTFTFDPVAVLAPLGAPVLGGYSISAMAGGLIVVGALFDSWRRVEAFFGDAMATGGGDE
jgi:hypothetical protein